MFQGDAAHGGLIELVLGNGLGTGGRQAVVEAFGERAGFAVAGLIRVLAGLVAGYVLQYAQVQWCLAVRTQALQSVQRELTTGRLGREKKQPIHLLFRHRLELREQGAERLADAGGGLGHQRLAVTRRAVNRLGQLALAGTETGVGEGQLLQLLVAGTTVMGFLPGPGDEAVALLGEELA